jgi:hypothetical protein
LIWTQNDKYCENIKTKLRAEDPVDIYDASQYLYRSQVLVSSFNSGTQIKDINLDLQNAISKQN